MVGCKVRGKHFRFGGFGDISPSPLARGAGDEGPAPPPHLKTRSTRNMLMVLTPPPAGAVIDHRQLPRNEHIHVPSSARTM